MAHLRLSLLGSPEVWCGGQALTFPTRKVLALLVYLVVERGTHSREKLTGLLWPESDAARGRGSLRTTLAFLRRAFDSAPPTAREAYLIIEPDTLGFDFNSDFELDLRLVTAALKTEAAIPLQAAADGYRGDFLEGFSLLDATGFDDWVTFQREHWHHRMNTVFDRLSQQQSAGRNFAGGITTAVRWVAHDPLNEAAHRRLIQLHGLAGNKTAALQAYLACRTILAKELAAEPSLKTESLIEHIHALRLTADDLPLAAQNQNRQSKIQNRQWITPFVGRTVEHTQLAATYQVTGQNQTQLVTIEGEAGIGKTRLILEFLDWATAQGADVLRGRAFEAGGRLPYQPVVEALRQRVDQENAPDDLLSDVWLAELGRLLPELRDRYPDLPYPTHDETLARTRLLEAVARLGQALASRVPVVFFIDDVHWADSASLDVLHYCGRAWTEANTPILLLMTVRSEALSTTPLLEAWLSGLGRDVALTRLTLGPITADETQQLVEILAGEQGSPSATPFDFAQDTLRRSRGAEAPISPLPLRSPAWFTRWLFDETAGQPFYISEMIKTLIEQGLLQSRLAENGVWIVEWPVEAQPAAPLPGLIPPSVREVILTRLHRLTPNATALLTAAAVIGRDCSFERLCQVAGLAAGEGLPALDELLSGRLLLETDDPARPYTFAHDKIRDVVYTEAGAARRRLYHHQAFTILEAE
ncbi:MAG TPA: AAA family ATPase, partial [Anaerolineae bacterium]